MQRRKFVLGFCVIILLLSVFPFLPVNAEKPSGDISFQPNIIPFLHITDRPSDKPESFRFEWLGNRFDIELFFNATYKDEIRLFSLRDFEDDFDVTVDYIVNKSESIVQFGWFISDVEDVSDLVHNAWFKIEDTQPFDYEDIELEDVEFFEESYEVTRFHLPDNLVLSFEDLHHKGFVIGHQNKTSTSVKGFSGKSSWNLDPITFSGNTITDANVNTEGTADDCDDLHNADLAGSRELMANASATTDMSLVTQIAPADDKALKLTLEASNFTSGKPMNETRYLRYDSWIVNGIEDRRFGTSQTDLVGSGWRDILGNHTVSWYIHPVLRHANATATVIAVAVANVSRTVNGQGIQNATWNCPQTVFEAGDALEIDLRIESDGGWTEFSWITEQLNASELSASTWTVCYYTERDCYKDNGDTWTAGYIRFGNLSRNSRIVNVNWISQNAEVDLNGTDKDDGVQTETVTITGNGNFTSSLWFKTISASGVDCYGTFYLRICQERWGVVWKEDNEFKFNCYVIIGSGTSTTWFIDTNKLIEWDEYFWTSNGGAAFHVKANAHLRFGTLLDASEKIGASGCTMRFTIHGYVQSNYFVYGDANSDVELYFCKFIAVFLDWTRSERIWIAGEGEIYQCSLYATRIWIPSGGDADIFDLTGHSYSGITPYAGTVTMDRINLYACRWGIAFYTFRGGNVSNLRSRVQATEFIYAQGITVDHYIVNGDIDSWNIRWQSGGTAEIYRQYEFDLAFTFWNGSYAEGTNVTISNNYLGTSDSWLTYANGSIPQQTYSMGHYNVTGDDTIYDYNPYNITATLDGYQTYTTLFDVTEQTELIIALTPTVLELFDSTYYLLGGISFLPLSLLIAFLVKRREQDADRL